MMRLIFFCLIFVLSFLYLPECFGWVDTTMGMSFNNFRALSLVTLSAWMKATKDGQFDVLIYEDSDKYFVRLSGKRTPGNENKNEETERVFVVDKSPDSSVTLVQSVESTAIPQKDKVTKMILDIGELNALALVYESPILKTIPVAKYKVNLDEREDVYAIYFEPKDKPVDMLGTMKGFPEPNFDIDKRSGKIINQYFNR
jgi:hypothetical protein